MTFLLYVFVFVTCACFVVPLLTFAVLAARAWRRKGRGTGGGDPVSFLPTDGVR